MTTAQWRCAYCGATNDPDENVCARCHVIGVKSDPKSLSTIAFGFLVLVLFIGALLIGFL